MQDLDTRTSRKPPTRAFIQAPLRHGMCKLLNKGPFRKDLTRISTRSSVKDLCRIMQQVRRKDFSRTLTRARLGESLRTPRRRLCASLRGRNAHGHVQVPRKYAKFYCKNATKQMASHDPTPASTPTVRNPSVWTHCLGNNNLLMCDGQTIYEEEYKPLSVVSCPCTISRSSAIEELKLHC